MGDGRRILFLGAETSCHVTRWVRHLRAQGHDVVLATLHPAKGGSAVRLVPSREGGPTALIPLLRASLRLRILARHTRPDVTIAYYLTSYGLLSRFGGVRPCVGVAVGGDILVDAFDAPLHRVRNGLAARLALSSIDGLCVWGEHVADRAARLGYARDRVFVLPRGVDRTLFPYRPPRAPGDPGPLRILSTRWFKPLYQVDTLIHALGLLKARGVPFEARVIGRGSEGPKLQRMATARGLDGCVAFPGSRPADEMPSQMAWADCYVSTSCTDGASSSLFEALATGLYPVVTDIPANRNFVQQGGTGAFFPTGDAEALAAVLARVAADRSGMVRSIEAARKSVAANLDYPTNMARINAFVLAHGPARAPARGELAVPAGRS